MINNVVLMGRMTRDPELRKTNTDKSVVNFTIAVDRFGKDNGADFINCVAWEKTADFINGYFSKGSMIAVSGSISTRSYEDKDGNKRTATEVTVREASFCGGKNDNQPSKGNTLDAAEEVEEIEDDEDLPF